MGLSPRLPRAQGRMGALGHRGPSVCSGLVAPEMPGLGIKPVEGQILLPKHKRALAEEDKGADEAGLSSPSVLE